jgi:uncharacterized protein (DUF983 family)
MARDIGVDDVLRTTPEWPTLLRRGVMKQCPRCGTGGLYEGWFRMKERCPGCGIRFEREPGFFVGAYLINLAIAEGLAFVWIMGFILWKDQNPDAAVVVPLVVAVLLSGGAPILFYPFARTIWSAIDVGMTPLELHEIVDATDAVNAAEESAASGDAPMATGPDETLPRPETGRS